MPSETNSLPEGLRIGEQALFQKAELQIQVTSASSVALQLLKLCLRHRMISASQLATSVLIRLELRRHGDALKRAGDQWPTSLAVPSTMIRGLLEQLAHVLVAGLAVGALLVGVLGKRYQRAWPFALAAAAGCRCFRWRCGAAERHHCAAEPGGCRSARRGRQLGHALGDGVERGIAFGRQFLVLALQRFHLGTMARIHLRDLLAAQELQGAPVFQPLFGQVDDVSRDGDLHQRAWRRPWTRRRASCLRGPRRQGRCTRAPARHRHPRPGA